MVEEGYHNPYEGSKERRIAKASVFATGFH